MLELRTFFETPYFFKDGLLYAHADFKTHFLPQNSCNSLVNAVNIHKGSRSLFIDVSESEVHFLLMNITFLD